MTLAGDGAAAGTAGAVGSSGTIASARAGAAEAGVAGAAAQRACAAVEAIVSAARDLSGPVPPMTRRDRASVLRARLAEIAAPVPSEAPAPYDAPADFIEPDPAEPVHVDGLLITNLVHVGWLTGFSGSAGSVWVPTDPAHAPVLIVDSRYGEMAHEQVQHSGADVDVSVYGTSEGQAAALRDALGSAVRVGLEAASVTLEQHSWYARRLVGCALVPVSQAVQQARRAKDDAELFRLARAAAIADEAFAVLLGGSLVGRSERDLAVALADHMEQLGGDGLSFATIVASGPNGSRPHHQPTTRVVREGDLVTFDFGAMCQGYHSDMTRTVIAGGPLASAAAAVATLALVTEVQALGAQLVRDGVHSRSIDASIRRALDVVGRGDEYVHGTGHGVGLDIHEEPYLGRTTPSTLVAGEVVTVEPGLYVAGDHGARVEDSLVVCTDGAVVLTRIAK